MKWKQVILDHYLRYLGRVPDTVLMKKKYVLLFWSLILFSVYHFIRDILQTLNIENVLTLVFKTNKNWCGWYCNLITIPFEIFIFTCSLIIIRRKKGGTLAYLVGLVFLVWLTMFLYDVAVHKFA